MFASLRIHIHTEICSLTESMSRSVSQRLWWGRDLFFEKVSTDSIGLSEMLSLTLLGSVTLWMRSMTKGCNGFGIFISLSPTLLYSLALLFFLHLLVETFRVDASWGLKVFMCDGGVSTGMGKMCRWISAKPVEGPGNRDSLFFVDEKQYRIYSTSA